MKVLLAYRCHDEGVEDASSQTIPAGLRWMAAGLVRDGHDARAVNFSRLGWKDIEKYLLAEAPGLVGLSCLTANRDASARLARLVRRTCPSAAIVLGGPHATALPEAMLRRVREADVVAPGEGELVMADIARELDAGRDPWAVAGLVTREGTTGERPPPANLDGLPRPVLGLQAAGLLPDRDLRIVVASRMRRGGPERRSPDSVVLEIAELRNEHGVIEADLAGDGLFSDPAWIERLSTRLLATKTAVEWELSASPLDVTPGEREQEWEHALRVAHAAGCQRVRVVLDVEDAVAADIGLVALAARLTEMGRLVRAAGLAPFAVVRFGKEPGGPEEITALRGLLRAFGPREGELEAREIFPGPSFVAHGPAEMPEAEFFARESAAAITVIGEGEAEMVRASLEPVLRQVARSVEARERDLVAQERAAGSTARMQIAWGDYRLRVGDVSEAERCYRLAAELAPHDPFPWLRLARLMRRAPPHPDQEVAALRQVLQRVPRHAATRDRLELLAAPPTARGRGRSRTRTGVRRGP